MMGRANRWSIRAGAVGVLHESFVNLCADGFIYIETQSSSGYSLVITEFSVKLLFWLLVPE